MTSTGYHSLLFKGGCRMFWPGGGIKSLGKKENILVDGARRPVSSIWETPNPCVVSAQGFGPHSGCFNWILLHAGSRWLIYSGNDLLGAVHIWSERGKQKVSKIFEGTKKEFWVETWWVFAKHLVNKKKNFFSFLVLSFFLAALAALYLPWWLTKTNCELVWWKQSQSWTKVKVVKWC